MNGELGFEVQMDAPQDAAVERVTEALKREGFGVLTRIELDAAFKEKLGIDFRPYTILGACNPSLAYKALSSRPDVGLLLPCNVTVEAADDGASIVRITDPMALLSMGGAEASDESLDAVAADARERLARVAAELTVEAPAG